MFISSQLFLNNSWVKEDLQIQISDYLANNNNENICCEKPMHYLILKSTNFGKNEKNTCIQSVVYSQIPYL